MSIPDLSGEPSAQMRLVIQASYWTTLLWPLVLTTAIAVIKRKQLLRPRLFVGLGSLVCFGVIFLVGQLRVYWYFPLLARTPADEIPRVVAGSALGMLITSIPLSILALYWLYRVCATSGSTSNNSWRGP